MYTMSKHDSLMPDLVLDIIAVQAHLYDGQRHGRRKKALPEALISGRQLHLTRIEGLPHLVAALQHDARARFTSCPSF
jgi:hypothetical protein